jgi:hypothetical protein
LNLREREEKEREREKKKEKKRESTTRPPTHLPTAFAHNPVETL